MADGSAHKMYSVEETVYGTTPTNPALDQVRLTGTTLALARDSLQSEEIRDDRQITDFRLGANRVAGDINFEMSYSSFDQFLEAVLCSADWASPATTGTTTLDATGTGFSRASGSFVTDGFEVGQMVVSSGFAASGFNGFSVITAVDALTMTTTPVSGSHGVEAGDGDELVLAAEVITGGTTRRSFSFIRDFTDIQSADYPFYIYDGCELTAMSLRLAANAMITGTFSVVGQSLALAQDLTGLGTPTYNAVSTTEPMDSFTGTIDEGGTTIAVVTELTLNLANTIEPRYVVGSRDGIYPSIGRSNLPGQVTAYFDNSTLMQKFINETESSISFFLPDAAGNYQRYRIPRIKYTGAAVDVTGEGPITIPLPFQAVKDNTLGTNLLIERLT